MWNTIKTFFYAFLVALTFPATAQDLGVSSLQLNAVERHNVEVFPMVRTLGNGATISVASTVCAVTSTVGAPPRTISASARTNIAGYLASQAAAGVVTTWSVESTAIAPMAYAGKVQVGIYDASADTTPTCSGVELYGQTWDGRIVRETSAAAGIAEATNTRYLSTKSYRRLLRVTLSGCAGVDADDQLLVRQTPHIALSRKVQNSAASGGIPEKRDVDSICYIPSSGTANLAIHCMHPLDVSFDGSSDANTFNIFDTDVAIGAAFNSCPGENGTWVVKYNANKQLLR
jgi:hypothetical protein